MKKLFKFILKVLAFPFTLIAFIIMSPILAWLVLFYFTKEDAEKIAKA